MTSLVAQRLNSSNNLPIKHSLIKRLYSTPYHYTRILGEYPYCRVVSQNSGNILLRGSRSAIEELCKDKCNRVANFMDEVNADQSLTMAPFSNSTDISVDISGDGGVRKVILNPGDDENKFFPLPGDTVSVHYRGWFENGIQFDSSRDSNKKYTFILGRGAVIKGWDIGVMTMNRGEMAVFHCLPGYAYGTAGLPPLIPPSTSLVFEIELLDWTGEDLSKKKDGGIMRSIIRDGEGHSTPNEGSTCTVHITGMYKNQVFQDADVSFIVGEGSEAGVVNGIERAIRSFRKDEKSRLHVASKYAFGSSGNPEYNIPSDAAVIYEVELEDFCRVKEHWEMDWEELLKNACIAKERGTEFFKMNKFLLAKRKYKKSVQYADAASCKDPESIEQRKNLLLAGHLNMSLCHLRLGNNLRAYHSADLALQIDSRNTKGLYRRGLAHFNVCNMDDAIKDFAAILEIEPTNKSAYHQLQTSKAKKKELIQLDKAIFGGMFQRFADFDTKKETDINGKKDVFSNIGDWNNDLAKDMMTLEQEMAAFGEQMPEPKYQYRKRDEKENENPDCSDDDL